MSAVTASQYQLFDPLSEGEYASLKASIRERRQVLVPVEYDEHGNILDGHHRVQICAELGIKDFPRIIRPGMTEAEKEEHVASLNLRRRHLNSEQKRKWIGWYLRRHPEWSDHRIADAVGASQPTVGVVRKDLVSAGEVKESITRIGKDEKPQPAKKTAVLVHSATQQNHAQDALQILGDDAPDKHLELKRLERIAREKVAEERATSYVDLDDLPGTIDICCGDFRSIELEDASVDLIFTDPPYPAEFLPLWSDLGERAAKWLRPGRLLVAYTGAYYLLEVLDRLREHLEYVWCGAIVTSGPHAHVHPKRIRQGSKPLLFFSAGIYEPDRWFADTYQSEGAEKDGHAWQQSIGAARYFIETLTNPGELVVDPFLGAGTTAVACKELGRACLSRDIDPVAIGTALERLG